jgi:hypothetical protein
MLQIDSSNLAQVLVFLFGMLLFLALGGVLILQAFRSQRRVWESASWSVTPGVITVSRVTSHTQYDTQDRVGYRYVPDVQYTYTIKGQTYTGDRVSFAILGTSQAHANAIVDRFMPGAEVSVHYNPRNPREAVLEVTQSGARFGFLLTSGILLALVGLGIACIGWYFLTAKL